MDKLFELSWGSFGSIVLSALGIYVTVIVMTRICGKRSFSKMSSFDYAMTVAIGSIIATTVLSSTVSMFEGIAGIVTVFILQVVAALARRNKKIRSMMDNSPLLLMDGATVLQDNLRKARVTEGDLRSKLREANVTEISQIKAVVFETTGDISVLHKSGDEALDIWLLKDVMRD